MCILQRLACRYFQTSLLKTRLLVVRWQIYLRKEHSPAGHLHHFHGNCYNDQKDVPRAGLHCSDTSFPCIHTQEEVDAGSTTSILQQQQVELPLHTEKLR